MYNLDITYTPFSISIFYWLSITLQSSKYEKIHHWWIHCWCLLADCIIDWLYLLIITLNWPPRSSLDSDLTSSSEATLDLKLATNCLDSLLIVLNVSSSCSRWLESVQNWKVSACDGFFNRLMQNLLEIFPALMKSKAKFKKPWMTS